MSNWRGFIFQLVIVAMVLMMIWAALGILKIRKETVKIRMV